MWSSLVCEMISCHLCTKESRRERGNWLVIGRLLQRFTTPEEDEDYTPNRSWWKLPLRSPVEFDGNVHRSCSTARRLLKPVSTTRLVDIESVTRAAQVNYEVRLRHTYQLSRVISPAPLNSPHSLPLVRRQRHSCWVTFEESSPRRCCLISCGF